MVCVYRPRRGKEEDFLAILRGHWAALRAAGLVTAKRARLRRATDRRGRSVFVEEFEWRDGRAAERAHATPGVLALWDPMERIAEEMEFLETSPVPGRGAGARAARPPRSGGAASRAGRKRRLKR